MHQALSVVLTVAALLGLGAGNRLETRDSYELEPAARSSRAVRWPTKNIQIALSSSLLNPGSNIKSGTDVVGAAKRSLARWASLANINFVVTWSQLTSVSPASAGDGVSLITIADSTENEAFNSDSTTGRTRIFYDRETGEIAEADVSINPKPKSPEGAELQFSSDGSPGTYDLEATFTHEIGHLLGLDHSAVLAATMQSQQAFNGTFGLPALTERTLSEDDRQRIRSLYGPSQRLGKIEGRLSDNRTPGLLSPLAGVNVWAENAANGRVVASATTDAEGNYHLDGLTQGRYRVMVAADDSEVFAHASLQAKRVRSFEISSNVTVSSDGATVLNNNLVPAMNSSLTPRFVGINGELSTVAVPLEPGKKMKVFLSGEGLDQVPGASIVVNSPYFTVDPATLTREQIASPFPVISIEVTAAPNVPFGDYTIRLQSTSGEVAFVPGAVTIDPAVNAPIASPLDDFNFFVRQQFSDLLGAGRLDVESSSKLVAQLSQCGNRKECIRARRLDISTTLFIDSVLPNSEFIHKLYLITLGRRPQLSEFENDRTVLRAPGDEAGRRAFLISFMQRPEFERRFPENLKTSDFADALLSNINKLTAVDLSGSRKELLETADNSEPDRVSLLAKLLADQSLADAFYNQVFVSTQYLAYLRRDPDDSGFSFWVSDLKNKPPRDSAAARSMVCAFLNSTEYQERFGLLTTHTPGECN
jgi:hypothetical protein